MEKYKVLEHTADAKFQAFGKTLEEAFGNAAIATFDIMVKTSKVKPIIKEEISVEGRDHGSLLYNFIEALLILLDINNFVLNSFEKIKISKTKKGFKLDAVALGDSVEKYETAGVVKAMTYNDMDISGKQRNWVVQFVVDI